MDIIFSEKDLADAVRLYLAYSGITRTVTNVDFARKLRGDDAGITATFELSDQPLDPAMLANLAMERKRALDIENGIDADAVPAGVPTNAIAKASTTRPVEKTAPAAAQAAKTPPKTADEAIPAPLATPEELGAALAVADTAIDDDPFGAALADDDIPFGDAEPDPEPDPESESGNDEVPESSPFADADSATSDNASDDESDSESDSELSVDYTPDSDNPFGDVVTPIDDEAIAELTNDDDSAEEEPAEEVSLFG